MLVRMNICLFEKDEISRPLSARDERGEHILKILRKKEGDSFRAAVIDGEEGIAVVTKITGKEDGGGKIFFDFKPSGECARLWPLALIVGFPRPIQLKRLLRDAASMGVCAIHLAGTALGEKSYMDSSLLERGAARKALVDGAAQAGSARVPELFFHRSLGECLDAQGECGEARVALDNVGASGSLANFFREGGAERARSARSDSVQAIAAIGSERGWTDGERRALETAGFSRRSMGHRILRTETAAVAACAIIISEMGWMEGSARS